MSSQNRLHRRVLGGGGGGEAGERQRPIHLNDVKVCRPMTKPGTSSSSSSSKFCRKAVPVGLMVLAGIQAVLLLVPSTRTSLISRMTRESRDYASSKRKKKEEEGEGSIVRIDHTNDYILPRTVCIANVEDMPPAWQPPNDILDFPHTEESWTDEEQELADEGAETGLVELLSFFRNNLTSNEEDIEALVNLGTDAINVFVDQSYAATNNKVFRARALIEASGLIKYLATPYTTNEGTRGCTHSYPKRKYATYAHYISTNLPNDKDLAKLRDDLVTTVNDLFDSCGHLDDVVGIDIDETMSLEGLADVATQEDSDIVYHHFLLEAVVMTDCLSVPGIIVPRGTEEFITRVWDEFLPLVDLPYARDVEDGYKGPRTLDLAYMATHIPLVQNGYGRHKLTVEDAPYAFRYIRDNFYSAMQFGVLDLLSEFLELLRSYGCTEENDVQIRHGTRYLLHLYVQDGHSWINHREPYEEDEELGEYELIHKPWNAISGVRTKEFEPEVPGSYGFAFRKAIQKGRSSAS